MATKYHVSADGNPHKCFASVRPCPLGGPEEHYASEADARQAFEASMADQTFPTDGKKGYTITSLVQVGESTSPNNPGTFQRLPIKKGFATPEEAIEWAKANLSSATPLINLENEDYTGPRTNENGDILAPREGEFKSLNLIDISEERQALDSGDIPTMAKYYLAQSADRITDVHSLRQVTAMAGQVLPADQLGRLRGYLKAATYGKK